MVVASFCFWGGGVPFPAFVVSSAMGVLPVFPVRSAHCKVPVRARSRSDKYAAVLRLQNTQPKDRRIYTVLTGILAEQQPWQNNSTQRAGEGKENPGRPEPTYAGLQSIFLPHTPNIQEGFSCKKQANGL